jgi:hypothetical protein
MVSPVAHRSCFKTGGGERARTVDLRLAKPALSQLSYTPVQMTDIRYQKQRPDRPESHRPSIPAVLISDF